MEPIDAFRNREVVDAAVGRASGSPPQPDVRPSTPSTPPLKPAAALAGPGSAVGAAMLVDGLPEPSVAAASTGAGSAPLGAAEAPASPSSRLGPALPPAGSLVASAGVERLEGLHHLALPDGSAYFGEMGGGRMHGRGVFVWPDGARTRLGGRCGVCGCGRWWRWVWVCLGGGGIHARTPATCAPAIRARCRAAPQARATRVSGATALRTAWARLSRPMAPPTTAAGSAGACTARWARPCCGRLVATPPPPPAPAAERAGAGVRTGWRRAAPTPAPARPSLAGRVQACPRRRRGGA